MARLNWFDRLPPGLRLELAERRRAGHTIWSLVSYLEVSGHPVCKSAVGRWVRTFDAEERAAASQQLAPAVAELRAMRLALEAIANHLSTTQTTI